MPVAAIEIDELTAGQPRSVAEYALAGGKVVLGLRGVLPAWIEPTLKSLGSLLELSPNWDSYNARAIEPPQVWAAWAALTAIMKSDSPAPAVIPTPAGGIQLEWHQDGIDLEFEVTAQREYRLSVECANTGDSWDNDNVRDLSLVAEWIARLPRAAARPFNN